MKSPLVWLCPPLLLLLASLPALAQNLSITSALNGAPGPFIRSEVLNISLTGAQPFLPVSLLFGNPAATPLPLPGVAGQLAIQPGSFQSFGPWDGLGLFGPPAPFITDAAGSFNITILIPASFPAGGLPFAQVFQAVTLINPLTAPGGESFALSNPVTMVIDEPGETPTVSEVIPHVVPEGNLSIITLRGTGFLTRATLAPTVRFTSLCSGAMEEASGVQLISDPLSPSGISLLVTAPATVGGPTAPPLTNSGPVVITVTYEGTGLYPNNPASATSSTAPSGEGDPTFLAWQTSLVPAISTIFPRINTVAGGCPITITGNNFLNCSKVIFDVGGSEVSVTPTVVSDTELGVVPPPLAQGAHPLAVRNPDHVSFSPRQSAQNPSLTDFFAANFSPSGITVTSVTPSSLTEGTSGTTVTVSGTCPTVAGYTLLDPQSGATGLVLGADIAGSTVSVTLTVGSVTIPTPGNFQIQAPLPAFPPGLNPTGPSANGLTNTGFKHFQVVAPFCLNPAGLPHKDFASIPSTEPQNNLLYQTQNPPTITGYAPNNCAREDGNQTVIVNGSNFFTADAVVLGSNPALGPQVSYTGTLSPDIAVLSVAILDQNTLQITTPDVSALSLPLPFTTDVQVTNPDTRMSSFAGSSDDFNLYPSLAGTVPLTFPTTGTNQVATTTLGGPGGTAQIFTFTGDLTLGAALVLNSTGDHPLIIRVRGNVVIDGTVDVSGASVGGLAPFFHPGGAGRGGAAADLNNLAPEDPAQGMLGSAPLDPLSLLPFISFGGGGFTSPQAGGGGGGASEGSGAGGQPGAAPGGFGGVAMGFSLPPIPVLMAGDETELRYPPGGGGGGAGGLGTSSPLNPSLPAAAVGQNGAGGHGGGGLIIACDGTITVNGTLLLDGQTGGDGAPSLTFPAQGGGGGGGGGGGTLILQAIQGIFINGSASLSALGGAGGLGGVAAAGAGGFGGVGAIRLAIPALSANPAQSLVVDPGATLTPPRNSTITY